MTAERFAEVMKEEGYGPRATVRFWQKMQQRLALGLSVGNPDDEARLRETAQAYKRTMPADLVEV